MRSTITRNAFLTALVAASVWLGGCATMQVNSFVERGADVRQFKTYQWGAPDTWSIGDPRLDNNRFFDERVRARVEAELSRRGYEKAPGKPDFVLHYHASVTQEISSIDLDRSVTPRADEDRRPTVFDKGTLFVDIVEPGSERLLWRGWAEGSIDGVVDNQRVMEEQIDKAVARIIAQLPSRS